MHVRQNAVIVEHCTHHADFGRPVNHTPVAASVANDGADAILALVLHDGGDLVLHVNAAFGPLDEVGERDDAHDPHAHVRLDLLDRRDRARAGRARALMPVRRNYLPARARQPRPRSRTGCPRRTPCLSRWSEVGVMTHEGGQRGPPGRLGLAIP
jgi:hypothetical protein